MNRGEAIARGAPASAASGAARRFGAGAIAGRVASLDGWRRNGLAFIAGSLSVLAMAPFFMWPILFLTLPVLVWLVDGTAQPASTAATFWQRPVVRAATAGWWFGFGYFLFGLFWIGEAFLVEADKFAWLLPFAVTMMPAGLALFTAGATASARLYWLPGIARVLVLALTFSGAEWLRGHLLTGFPWNVLGYALTWPLPMMQAAAFVGVYGLTLLAVLIFAGPLVMIAESGGKRAAWTAAAIATVPLLLLYAAGAWRLSGGRDPNLDGVRIRIVQASVDQRDKWRPEKQGPIFQDQLNLSRQNSAGQRDDLAGITHLIWPEAAMPFLPLEHPEALAAIGDLLPPGTQLITGALRLKHSALTPENGAREGYNSLMVFGDKGNLESVYDKIHLVPFGEYLPLQSTLEWIGLRQLTHWRGGFSAGRTPRPVLDVGGLPPVGGLICYEAIFPAAVVQGAERPGLLINLTNDGWFGDTTGPLQHFHQSRVRAVEEGLPLIRSANNGVSAVVDGHGRILAILPLNARGVVDSAVPEALAPTVYATFGDWTFVVLALLFVTGVAIFRRERRMNGNSAVANAATCGHIS
jgi:apolipoprotein N-acyltransferase